MRKITFLLLMTFAITFTSKSQSGYALNLPGGTGAASTSSLSIPTLNTLINQYPFTVEMWVKPTSWVSYGGFFVDRSGNINSVQFDNNASGYLRSDFNANARFVSSLTGAIPTAGVWNHISLIVRTDSVLVELNGVYYAVSNTVPSWNSSFFSNTSYIGSDPVVAGRNIAGLFDEVRIWNTARTRAEITANKNVVLNGNETGLVAYYNFDNQNGNDISSNGKNATINGGTFSYITTPAKDATLSNITLSNGVLDKDFNSGATSYNVLVAPAYSSITATGVPTQNAASVSNSPSDISASNTTVTMACTSSDGSVVKNYTLNYSPTTFDYWDGNGVTGNRSYPHLWGWSCSNTTTCWSLANSSGTACRFNDVTSGWTFNGSSWTGRDLYIRWDGVGGTSISSIFSYPIKLEACQTYVLNFKYAWANNATVPTLTTAISSNADGTSPIITKDFVCSSTKQLFSEGTITVNVPTAGVYYFTIGASTAALCAVADLSITQNTAQSLTVSESSLAFNDINNSHTFTVSGNNLIDLVQITPPVGIFVSPTQITVAQAQCGATVTATSDGITSITNGSILVSSGAFSQSIIVNAIIGDAQCFTPLYAGKTNLIKDPFINSLSNFSGWGTRSLDSVSPYCGKYSGAITTSGSIDQSLSLTPYTKYRMRAMIKTMGGTFQLGVAKYDGSSPDINQVIDTQEGWQALDFTFQTGATVTGALTFFNNYQKTGSVGYIDNWELYEIGEVSGMDINISTEPISENEIKSTLREMLAKHLVYSEGQFSGSYFGNGQSVEHGARTNADYALMYAFIHKKAQEQPLPNGITFATVKQHALDAIRYSYNTHTANKIKTCTDSKYWGLVWESSMWSTSTAYAAWLMWNDLTTADQAAVKKMIVAEADYKLSTPIPTGVNSDTKAEENGWDTNILAIAAAMFPEEKNAEAWTYRCKQYAMNTYSVDADIYNYKVVDGKYVRDWHIGANLFPDYALENHNFFHTSYLNIPIQEMSESYLAYKAVSNNIMPPYITAPEALKHNVEEVWNSMLKEFIMADGILAMPNGNDWSMYIYDELGTYSALASIYRDPDALMLESLVLQYAKYRQSTTSDGSFLLNPDVGERRMAVTARRLVFAHLYHDYFSTTDMTATKWSDFSKRHETTKYLPYSKIIRSNNDDRYVTFSWFQSADGSSYKSYMGMASPNNANYSNIIFPLKVGNTGNFTGYTDISGKTRNASFVESTYAMSPKSFSTTGKLTIDDNVASQYITFYSTPGNAVIYMDEQVANTSGSITKEGGLMLGITTDILTKLKRTLYYEGGSATSDGTTLTTLSGNWANIDNQYGIVVNGGKGIAFGEKELKTSVYVSKLYGSYSTTSKSFTSGEVFHSRSMIAYPNINSATTQLLANKAKYPTVAAGWKAVAAEDPDGKRHLVVSNFRSSTDTDVTLSFDEGAPVYNRVTSLVGNNGTATFSCSINSSVPQKLYCYVKDATLPLKAVQGDSPYTIYVKNENATDVSFSVNIWDSGNYVTLPVDIPANTCKYFQVENGTIISTPATFTDGYANVSKGKHILAADQHPEHFPFAMIDDDDATYYQSLILPTTSTPEMITIRLMETFGCNKLTIKSAANRGPQNIEIQTSVDGSIFTTVNTATLQNTTNEQIINFTQNDAKFVRIKVNSSYGAENVAIVSVQVFGYPK
ncbi:MAG: LamG-like jellyroll fold domain-containing protein [Paludibacteraceae bacterium]